MSVTNNVNSSNKRAFVLSTYDKVNFSPSQAKFSFGKANRFPNIRSNNPVSAYDLPDKFNKRATGFGIGSKDLVMQIRESPSPDRYKIQSTFDSNEKAARNAYFGKTRRTFCFGAGRDDFSRTVYNTGNMYPDRVVPGPGSYKDKTQDTGVNGVKYTLKERKFYMTDEETAIKRAVPPPGTYEDQQALDKKGNYASSQMVNSKAARINTGPRFLDLSYNNPGPGTYEEAGRIASGVQVCTNFHSTITKNMATTEKRHQWGGNPRFRTPGPGTYRPPSDFGYLDFRGMLRDNLNENNQAGFDTSTAGQPSALIRKNGSVANSLLSDKRHKRNMSHQHKTLEHENASGSLFQKKGSLYGGNTSRAAAQTMDSTHYSMNNSMQTPRDTTAITPMTNQIFNQDSELKSPTKFRRETKTPQMKFASTAVKKAKKANMNDMVVIYANDTNQKMLAQEAAIQKAALKQVTPQKTVMQNSSADLNARQAASELAPKPSSRDGPLE